MTFARPSFEQTFQNRLNFATLKSQPNHSMETTMCGESMMLFQRVLIPLGLMSDSHPILGIAADMAARFHSELLLLHLFNHTHLALRDPSEIAGLRTTLSKTARKLLKAGAERVYTAILEGNACYNIEEVARHHNASLILLTEEAQEERLQPWFGTATQRLARRALIPLLVIQPGAKLAFGKPIVCVVDFSESSRLALNHAMAMARDLQAKLCILHVVPEPISYPTIESPLWKSTPLPAVAATTAVFENQLAASVLGSVGKIEIERRLERAQSELAMFLADTDLSDIHYEIQVTCGQEVEKTLTVARSLKAGLIVAGGGSRAGFTLYETQTPAEALAQVADVPVLVFRTAPDLLHTSTTREDIAHRFN
ncbi:universal stress protein [candidate division KSB1 bacterium]|nr:MAG: universal stress protein [candidate division KSB1 bacterium]